MYNQKIENLPEIAKRVRKLAISTAYETKSRHIGPILSCIDILTVLFFPILNIDPKNPGKNDRDKFILSKGHAALALYAVLAERGFCDREALKKFGADGSGLGGHPDKNCLPGVEISTGSLGHGLSVGAGISWLAKKENRPNRVFVLLGDGECNEGSIWESAMFSGHHQLDNLVAIIDNNHLQGFGFTDNVLKMDNFAAKWSSFGWAVKEADGHNVKHLAEVFRSLPFEPGKPCLLIANTIKGKGVSDLENKLESHYLTLSEEQFKRAIKELES
jgi:transketolase